MIGFLLWCSLALAAAGGLGVCVLAARRTVAAWKERRRLEAEGRLLLTAIAVVEGDAVDIACLSEADSRVLASQLGRLGRSLRGASTERIARFFESSGLVEREVGALKSLRAWRRAKAAFALGDMGSPDAVPGLLEALRDPDSAVRGAAARSLGRLRAATAVAPIVFALAERQLPVSVAGQALLTIGSDALPGLRELETAGDAEARAFAVELVGLLGEASDVGRVLERLKDSSAEVRAKAARALGRLGAEVGAEELRIALQDRIPFVRGQAAHALGAVGDRDAVPALLEAACSDTFESARAAAHAAARLDPDAVRSATRGGNGGVHLREAVDLLGASG